MKPIDAATLAEFATPILTGLGYDLVDLEWKHEAGAWVLRVFVDLPASEVKGSHVSHEDCTRVSRSLGAELDVADLISVPFNLEVSSPGLNRPLRRESDFRRFAGRKVKVRTKAPLAGTVTEESPGGRRNFTGTIAATSDGRVRVDVEGRPFDIPIDAIEKANLVFEL